MKTIKLAYSLPFAFAAFAVAAVSGCSSATMHFFTLDSLSTAGAEPSAHSPAPAAHSPAPAAHSPAPSAHYAVLVGPVEIPPAVDRPQFVVHVTPNQVDIDELNCWAAPLDDGIARAVAGNLSVLLATHDVGVAPLANFQATHRVTLNVQRFDSNPGRTVSLDALWTVTPTALSGVARSGRTTADEAVTAPGYDALAAAHSRLLAKMSADIAATIEEIGKKKVIEESGKKKGR